MDKFILSREHKDKRAQKKKFVLRYDVLGTPIQEELLPHEYFDLYRDIPEVVDKVILDMMYSGDWYSIYESSILPPRRAPRFARLRGLGIDLFGEWVKVIHEKSKECWLTHRISEVDIGTGSNPVRVKEEHPEWFISAFGHKMNNMSIPEIRDHKLKVLAEVMKKYDFDGLDIDFERHTPYLPVGRQWEHRECVTEFMRELRKITLKIGEEKGRVVMLSARVPDCLKGCYEDGLDIETWINEDLVDCLTLGSRSFDIKVEEFRALSDDIQIYGCYDPHHTVDGYLYPTKEALRGIWYSHLKRGADAVEYFNWSGEGDDAFFEKYRRYAYNYGLNPTSTRYDNDDFTGVDDKAFLELQDKTYVLDRKGGYPWGVGYANLNEERQLPCVIENEGEVNLYVAENAGVAKSATLRLLFEELCEMPRVYFNGKEIEFSAKPHRDLQVTTEEVAPTSGSNVANRIRKGVDMSKPCTMLTADITGTETNIGYNTIRIVTKTPTSLEKVELDVKRI